MTPDMKRTIITALVRLRLLAALALLPLLALTGCARRAPLPGGYKVFQGSSHEVALAGGKYGAYVAGAELARLGSEGTLIFGEITLMPGRPASDSDTPGFFLLDTTTEVIQKGLSRENWLKKLHEAGVKGEPKLDYP